MVQRTYETLEAFPDRLLVCDNIVWSGNKKDGFYSSHRLTSPMTNQGPTLFGPATGRRVTLMNIAECVVENGQVTREWLVRDNLSLVTQLEVDPKNAAQQLADRHEEQLDRWIESEWSRVRNADGASQQIDQLPPPASKPDEFAEQVLISCWQTGNNEILDQAYAPYSVLHRSPVRLFSGRKDQLQHFAELRGALGDIQLSVDHVAAQPFGSNGCDIAARWSVAALHEGVLAGVPATGKPIYILGVSHWRCIDNRIAMEWTVFDELAVISQTLLD